MNYKQQIIDILEKHDGRISIIELRKHFLTYTDVRSQVTSALRGLEEKDVIRVIGGANKKEKMIELIKDISVGHARVVHLTNREHWIYPEIHHQNGLQSCHNNLINLGAM